MCRREIGHYRRQRGSEAIAFIDVAPAGDPAPDLGRDAALSRFHVRRPDGALLSGAAAFVAVWQRLPSWRPAARLAALPGILPLLEIGYRLSLRLRPRLAHLIGRVARR